MSEHANKREKRLAMLVVAAVVLVTVLLIVETFRLLLPGLWSAFSAGDEQALSEYLASQGRLRSFLTLWFLAVVQVLSLVIPAMPVQLAAGLSGPPGFSLQLPGVRSRCVCARLPAAAALSGPDCPRYFSRSSLFSFLKIAHLRRFVN